jgi:hypothetical protein
LSVFKLNDREIQVMEFEVDGLVGAARYEGSLPAARAAPHRRI